MQVLVLLWILVGMSKVHGFSFVEVKWQNHLPEKELNRNRWNQEKGGNNNNHNNNDAFVGHDFMKECRNCIHYKPNANHRPEDAFCTFFKTSIEVDGEEWQLYDYAIHCRNNKYLCGSFGYMYEEKPPEIIKEQ